MNISLSYLSVGVQCVWCNGVLSLFLVLIPSYSRKNLVFELCVPRNRLSKGKFCRVDILGDQTNNKQKNYYLSSNLYI